MSKLGKGGLSCLLNSCIMLLNAILYATRKHKNQKRVGGDPYITHPISVALILESKGFSQDYLISAIFHDLLEDTDAAEEEIILISNPEILQSVKLVTKETGYNMPDYIMRIYNNEMARMVKLADRLDNLRGAILTDKTFRKKYAEETKQYYLDLAKDTVFEGEIKQALKELELCI